MTVTPTAVVVAATPPPDWRAQLFSGALLIVTGVDELTAFRAYVAAVLEEAFAPAEPPLAQDRLDAGDFAARIAPLRRRFRGDARARELFAPVLQRFGLGAATTYWDQVSLRVLPSGDLPDGLADLALGAHRDTWSSNVYAQVNWWTPIHPVTTGRALAFYPRHWTRAIGNSSGAWDLHELRRQRADGGPPTVPLVPAPTAVLDPADAVIVTVQPGDLLLFSGAHLHATVPNGSGVPRFSVEVRTVAIDDVRAGRGAPNVDGAAPWVPWEWFRRVSDRTSLADALDDGDR